MPCGSFSRVGDGTEDVVVGLPLWHAAYRTAMVGGIQGVYIYVESVSGRMVTKIGDSLCQASFTSGRFTRIDFLAWIVSC